MTPGQRTKRGNPDLRQDAFTISTHARSFVAMSAAALSTAALSTVGRSAVALLTVALFASPALGSPDSGLRTLDEISIEGEIAMPQVLFITAREPYRFADTAHHVYLFDSEDLRQLVPTPIPFWIGRTLAPSVSIIRWDDVIPPVGSGMTPSPESPDGSQGRN